MNLRYLVKWSPYQVLRILYEGEECEIPHGCDIVTNLIDDADAFIPKWQGNINWEQVLGLYEQEKYLDIFLMHNRNEWTNEVYCCERYKKHVDWNVGLYKNTKAREKELS
jgi:hypothetical protein